MVAKQLLADLSAAKFEVWIDAKGLKPGTRDWEEAIREAIKQSDCVILVASPDSRRSTCTRRISTGERQRDYSCLGQRRKLGRFDSAGAWFASVC
ncbi:MAG: toll/interleukin-1 receptor domain-containing protein [Chloroflexi bacterium]|nr:toll/interleukin-1 receptor domain-containing protein [Chloroflexota bacterium]